MPFVVIAGTNPVVIFRGRWTHDHNGCFGCLRTPQYFTMLYVAVSQTMALMVEPHCAITASTLVLWGMGDPWQRSEDGQQLARKIRGAQFQPLHGVSHWAPQDAPSRFNKAVLEWLEQ